MTFNFVKTSYTDEINVLLTESDLECVSVEEKEVLIQSGKKHYSELIVEESKPSEFHIQAFKEAVEQNGLFLAQCVESISLGLVEQTSHNDDDVILISLVRAGIPMGCLLKRALDEKLEGRKVFHYGISIILDKGIDQEALDFILKKHGASNWFFVDGWTGKGKISECLKQSLNAYHTPIEPRLVVAADPCGQAWMGPSNSDWLIPFGIMNSVVSGLISRTINQPDNKSFHQCKLMGHLEPYDVSQSFIDHIDFLRCTGLGDVEPCQPHSDSERKELQENLQVIDHIQEAYNVATRNRVKPGIAEATRAVMRRVPEKVLVDSFSNPAISLIMKLAKEKNIDIEEVGDKIHPYKAITIIARKKNES